MLEMIGAWSFQVLCESWRIQGVDMRVLVEREMAEVHAADFGVPGCISGVGSGASMGAVAGGLAGYLNADVPGALAGGTTGLFAGGIAGCVAGAIGAAPGVAGSVGAVVGGIAGNAATTPDEGLGTPDVTVMGDVGDFEFIGQ